MFINFEGIDGSGKTSIINGLKTKLPEYLFDKEPTNGIFGKQIREYLKSGIFNPFILKYLFLFDRMDHQEFIKKTPNLILDRYFLSNIVYNCDSDEQIFEFLQLHYQQKIELPDLIIYIVPDLDFLQKRIEEREEKKDFFDLDFNRLKSFNTKYNYLLSTFFNDSNVKYIYNREGKLEESISCAYKIIKDFEKDLKK
jgi:dTMP kinase